MMLILLPCSSQLYQTFDQILLLSHGRALYSGSGGLAPARHFSSQGIAYQEGYNVADYLLDVASDPPVAIFPMSTPDPSNLTPITSPHVGSSKEGVNEEKPSTGGGSLDQVEAYHPHALSGQQGIASRKQSGYAATFLTQFEVLADREWKILRRYVALALLRMDAGLTSSSEIGPCSSLISPWRLCSGYSVVRLIPV